MSATSPCPIVRRRSRHPGMPAMLALLFLLALGLSFHAAAHVNNPYIVFEGRAGTLPVQVVIRQPDVVPGLAEITVQVLQGRPDRVQVLPLHWRTDRSGAPSPDDARPIPGETNRYAGELWLMTRGAHGIEVRVDAPGGGTVLVPVNSESHARKPMPSWLGWILGGLCAALALGVVAIAIAAARESTLPPETAPRRPRLMAAGISGAVALGLVLMATAGFGAWWRRVDDSHQRRMLYRQYTHEVVQQSEGDEDRLDLEITDPRRRDPAHQLVEDHGKKAHLFLVGEQAAGGIPAFAHLHPEESGNGRFTTTLPALPSGSYRVFTELAHAAGFTQTLTNRVALTGLRPAALDRDSAWAPAAPTPAPGAVSIGDGLSLQLETAALRAGEPAVLKARVRQADGSPAFLEPYLRMLGHAVFQRDDGAVFAHLHPAGSLSMAAARVFAAKLDGDAGARAADANCGDLEAVPPAEAAALGRSGEVRFPCVFPSAGRYFVWIQVRVEGQVRTAPFLVTVAE
ncbi:MAG: hypothetical protein J0L84_02930 [Verrucomicrobia bacterium]|nr:hypothetical protein [Verrucomicrobiota bacterium]